MSVLVISAHYAPEGDLDAHMDAVQEALRPLKADGTTGSVVSFDMDVPANFGLASELERRFDLDPGDLAA